MKQRKYPRWRVIWAILAMVTFLASAFADRSVKPSAAPQAAPECAFESIRYRVTTVRDALIFQGADCRRQSNWIPIIRRSGGSNGRIATAAIWDAAYGARAQEICCASRAIEAIPF